MTIEIHRVETDRDFARLRDLFIAYENELIPELRHGPVPEIAELKPAYSGPHSAFLAVGEQAVGCVAVRRFDALTAVVRHLFVERSARGVGAARALVTAAVEFARDGGCERVVLDTAKKHLPAAYRLYLSFGFTECEPYMAVDYRCPTFMELRLHGGPGDGGNG